MKKLSLLLFVALPLASVSAGPRAGGFSGSRTGPRGGTVEAEGVRAGRYRSGSVSAEGPNGGTYDASGTRFGRYGTGSVSAEGPNGGTYDASGTRYGRYGTGNANAQGPNGGTANASWSGYRTGYVYTGGVYRPANIVVNRAYVAPVGVYTGWTVVTQPYYVAYPAYATYPVEVSVQVQLQRRGYYGGPIDGDIGLQTQKAIAKYQADNGLPPTGQINEALLKSLKIT